jgi:hypothetical protein
MGVPRQEVGVAAIDDTLFPGTGEVLSIRRLTPVGRRRLALRGRLVASGDADPAATVVRLELDGRAVPGLAAASLVASRSGRHWRLARSARGAGFGRFDIRRLRNGDLMVRLAIVGDALPRAGVDATVTVVVAGRSSTGRARVRRSG